MGLERKFSHRDETQRNQIASISMTKDLGLLNTLATSQDSQKSSFVADINQYTLNADDQIQVL